MDPATPAPADAMNDLVDHPPPLDRLEHATHGIRLRGDDAAPASLSLEAGGTRHLAPAA